MVKMRCVAAVLNDNLRCAVGMGDAGGKAQARAGSAQASAQGGVGIVAVAVG
jgi:hypothetical protein